VLSRWTLNLTKIAIITKFAYWQAANLLKVDTLAPIVTKNSGR